MTVGLPDRSVPDIDRRGLRDRVYDRILDILLSSEMEPGARLSIDTLAKQLKVSPHRSVRPWCSSNARAS